MANLVDHGGTLVADDVAEPEGFDLGRDPRHQFGALGRQQLAIFELIETAGDRVELFEDGPPAGFAGMCREDGPDEGPIQQRRDLLRLKAPLAQLGQRHFASLGQRLSRILLDPRPQGTHPRLLLGEIDQIEVQAESPRQRAQLAQIEFIQSIAQCAGRLERGRRPQLLARGTNIVHQPERFFSLQAEDRLIEHSIEHACIKLQAWFFGRRRAVLGHLAQSEPGRQFRSGNQGFGHEKGVPSVEVADALVDVDIDRMVGLGQVAATKHRLPDVFQVIQADRVVENRQHVIDADARQA